ncbi:MAG: FAD:protein FMN transferase [Lachnospiraceae bacterium]|nr:FAD:protein FMN transferase [Lachnospiraceae bacterium]
MRQSTREWIFLFLVPLLLSVALCLSSCGQKKEPVVKSGFYFDTVITITLYGESEKLSPLFEDVFALCARYEAMLSRTVKDSDIARINEAAGTPVVVHSETISLLQTACSYAELTDGLVDPTVTPLLLLWGFGDTEASVPLSALSIPPDADALAEARSHVDHHAIVIDEQAGTVMLTDPYAAIDLGFIAKGYIADRIRDYLISQNVEGAIINLGGNVLCIGEKPDHSPYRVAVKYPFGGAEDVITTLSVRDQSVVTSGVYERFIELDGVRYHHILHPQTGYPVENGLLSVTIVTDSSTDADALSTACFILGLTDGMALIESLDHTEALFITEDYELHYSSRLQELH